MYENARWDRIERIFHNALAIDPVQRAEYIRHECAGDENLCRRVESLLASDDQTSVLDQDLLAQDGKQILGHYRLLSKLGEGGMGAVYLAQDIRLDRIVALKILQGEFANDPARKQRFIREAKAASTLNHPNIAAVFEFGTSNEIDYLVMEYVPGKPLDRLIPRNGLKVKEALRYGIQIADALVCAHNAGIIHRDLKPAEVLVTESGVAKVVDFGIAKQMRENRCRVELRASLNPALLRKEGVILGTVAYMSPEQAEGKPVDARSDIFSFGSLLYEMLTGRYAFRRDTTASTLAAVLREQPEPASALAEDVPPELSSVIDRCLRKSPADRFQRMSDVETALKELDQHAPAAFAKARAQPGRRLPRFIWAVGACVLVLIAGITALRYLKTNPPQATLQAVPLTTYPGWEGGPSFSPDGNEVVFSWCAPRKGDRELLPGFADNCNVYIKQIGVEPPFRLTSRPASEFNTTWSPDGKWIAFGRLLSANKLGILLIPPRGGHERILLEVESSRPGMFRTGASLAWTPDSKWLVSSGVGELSHLSLISIDSGEERVITNPPTTGTGQGGDDLPAVSPLGNLLAFARAHGRTDIYLMPLSGNYLPNGEPQMLSLPNWQSFSPTWLPDGSGLVFASGSDNGDGGLWRTSIARGARPQRLPFTNAGEPAISSRGNRLAYVEYHGDSNIWNINLLGPEHRPSVPEQIVSSTRPDSNGTFSPDGRQIAFISSRSGREELWSCDRDGSNPVQLTSLGSETSRHGQNIDGPQWSPDGKSIAAFLIGTDEETLLVMNANGSALRRLLVPGGGKWPSWSHEGKWLYFASPHVPQTIYKIQPTGGSPVKITTDYDCDLPQESPDGKFLYYMKGWPVNVSIWKIPVEGGLKTKVVDGVHSDGLWTVCRDGIYFFTTRDAKGHSEIRLYEFATKRVKKIATVEHRIDERIAVSSDERTIIYTQVDESGSDLMLVENFH